MQLLNDAQLLNNTFLLALLGAASVSVATVIVRLATIYIHSYNHINLTLTLKF